MMSIYQYTKILMLLQGAIALTSFGKKKTLGKKKKKKCRDPGSNQGPLDLQSNALPTELSRLPVVILANESIIVYPQI